MKLLTKSIVGLAQLGLIAVAAAGDTWTLDRALDRVAEDAPDARVATLRLEKAQAQLAEAKAQWKPRLTAESGYSATDNPTQAFMFLLNQRQLSFGGDFNDPAVTDNWGNEIRIEYPLYLGGARKANQLAATAGVEASGHDLKAVRRQLQLEVARTYFQIVRAREVVTAAEAALTSQRSNLELARELLEGGKALQTAVLDLETQVAQAEANLAAAENQRDIATAMLKSLIGLNGDTPFVVSSSTASIAWPGKAIHTPGRAEAQALRVRSEQADALIEVAKAGRRPKVAAFASARHDEGFAEPDGGSSWFAGVSVSLNIFDGGTSAAKIAQAEAEKTMVEEQRRKQDQQIDLQVKTAELNLDTARKRISFAKKALESAEESLGLTRERFKEGLALSTQLIDAESALTGTRVQLSGARALEQMALADLRHALGLPIRDTSNSK